MKEDDENRKMGIVSTEILPSSSSSLYCVSMELIEGLDIENYDLNLLEMDRALNIPFIEKVFKNVAYFNHSDVDAIKFQNFVFEIQRKY